MGKDSEFTSADAHQWALRFALFLAGVLLLFISAAYDRQRSLEMLIGVVLATTCALHVTIDLLLTFAAETVRPRKFGND